MTSIEDLDAIRAMLAHVEKHGAPETAYYRLGPPAAA
jgi:hypothetical protein